MNSAAAFAAIIFLVQTFRGRGIVRHTSMGTAWIWASVAAVVLNIFVVCRFANIGTAMIQSALQYSAAVFCLTPFIDILGARRPAHQAWPWFVICPMIVVLQWPAISQVAAGITDSPIEIQTPTFIGFLVVVVMGCGNYFGTNNTGPSGIAAAGIILLALPVSEWVEYGNSWMLPLAVVLLLLAVCTSQRPQLNGDCNSGAQNRHSVLWHDFCTMYGMVWAKRVMDRVNQFAERESWDVRMSVYGFIDHKPEAKPDELPQMAQEVSERSLTILCWVLRRFLDREFLIRYVPDAVIHKDQAGDKSSATVDS